MSGQRPHTPGLSPLGPSNQAVPGRVALAGGPWASAPGPTAESAGASAGLGSSQRECQGPTGEKGVPRPQACPRPGELRCGWGRGTAPWAARRVDWQSHTDPCEWTEGSDRVGVRGCWQACVVGAVTQPRQPAPCVTSDGSREVEERRQPSPGKWAHTATHTAAVTQR